MLFDFQGDGCYFYYFGFQWGSSLFSCLLGIFFMFFKNVFNLVDIIIVSYVYLQSELFFVFSFIV